MKHIKRATMDLMLRLARKRKVTHDDYLIVVDGVLSLNQNTSDDAIYAIFQLIGIEASTPAEAENDAD